MKLKIVTAWLPVTKMRENKKYLTRKGMVVKRLREEKSGKIVVKWWGDYGMTGEVGVDPTYQVISFSPQMQASLKLKSDVERQNGSSFPPVVIQQEKSQKKFKLKIKRRKNVS